MMRILIADDMEYARANIMELVKNIFPEAEIDAFSDGRHAWEAVKKKEYDLLFTDVRMSRMHGPELAEKVAEKHPHTEIFFVTGEGKAELEQLGIDLKRCIFKPYMIEDVKKCLKENKVFEFGSFGNELRP